MRIAISSVFRIFLISALALFLVPVLFAGGGREVETKISLLRPSTYISPTGPAEARHSLEIDNIQLQIDKKGTIKRYDFAIYDKTGKTVFAKSAVQTKGKGFLGENFNIGAGPGVSLPDKISWTGVDQDGKVVGDGEYFYQLTAIDSWDFPASTPPLSVVVDTVPPVISGLELATSIISPDGDGQKDKLAIRLATGPAREWVETVLDPAGAAIWKRTTTNAGDTERSDMPLPASLEWDPLTREDGSQRPDALAEGTYNYRLSGYDHAGNLVSKQVAFRISYAGSLISVSAENGVEVANADEGLVLLPTLAERDGASAWSLEIVDSADVVWRRFAGTGAMPERVLFSGRGKAGQPERDTDRLKDGQYSVRVRQDYESGFAATDQSFTFRMDSTPPVATLMLGTAEQPTNPALIPWFGGAKRAQLHIQVAVKEALDWTLDLVELDGRQEGFRIPLDALVAASPDLGYDWQWDGMVPEGSQLRNPSTGDLSTVDAARVLPNGRWSMRAVARDAGGNEGGSSPLAFVFQSGLNRDLGLSQDTAEISPGVAGAAEQVKLAISGMNNAEVDQVVLSVLDDQETEIFRKGIRPELPLTWQGQQGSGLPAANGTYRLQVLVQYRNGDEVGLSGQAVNLAGRGERKVVSESANEIIARAISLVVDTPLILDTALGQSVPVKFSARNADGFPGSVAWTLKVSDNQGLAVWQSSGTGNPPDPIIWDGKTKDGSWIVGLQRFTARWEMSGAALDGEVVVEKDFMTGIPVVSEGGRLRIIAPDILFEGNNPDPFAGDASQIDSNIDLLRRLGRQLARVSDHRIVIEGYATYVKGDDPKSMAREQKYELVPLSRERAHEVRKSLFTIGVDWKQMEIIAKGGSDPVAPYDDKSQAWKNRRVIMYLEG